MPVTHADPLRPSWPGKTWDPNEHPLQRLATLVGLGDYPVIPTYHGFKFTAAVSPSVLAA